MAYFNSKSNSAYERMYSKQIFPGRQKREEGREKGKEKRKEVQITGWMDGWMHGQKVDV